MLEFIFWLSVLGLAHTYIFYPLSLILLDAIAQRRRTLRRTAPTSSLPTLSVSVIVSAHNEARCIASKIRNTASLDYPRDRLELLIGDDGSTDETGKVAQQVDADFVRLIRAPRGGKAAMLNRLAAEARGEIFVFTDANTLLESDALQQLLSHFAEPRVGCVCGHLVLASAREAGQSEGAYWRYETRIKEYESRRGVVLGAAGGLYAIRKRLFRPLPAGMIADDFVVSMRAALAGYEVRYERAAVAHEEAADDYASEFRRRVRIAAGNWRGLHVVRALLAPSVGFVAYALWSHKVLRWFGPALLSAALVSSAVLAGSPVYAVALAAQLSFYAVALLNVLGVRVPGAGLARHFVAMNAALALGAWKYLRGDTAPIWAPTARTSG